MTCNLEALLWCQKSTDARATAQKAVGPRLLSFYYQFSSLTLHFYKEIVLYKIAFFFEIERGMYFMSNGTFLLTSKRCHEN